MPPLSGLPGSASWELTETGDPGLGRQVEVSVRNKILYLIQAWAHAFRNEPKYKVVQDTYQIMKVEALSSAEDEAESVGNGVGSGDDTSLLQELDTCPMAAG
ncbi:hypothetical protein P7K49_012111 [Saguinus oedipus]|uniref:VHS domain-containing protein n=1 Tax=Saguinus oedipus TaxID=9490 RepID=A0ABQ9VSJ7_SAGOE|nr:hypothetical protein P7K49_012111 [Saguinus oedipus]